MKTGEEKAQENLVKAQKKMQNYKKNKELRNGNKGALGISFKKS